VAVLNALDRVSCDRFKRMNPEKWTRFRDNIHAPNQEAQPALISAIACFHQVDHGLADACAVCATLFSSRVLVHFLHTSSPAFLEIDITTSLA